MTDTKPVLLYDGHCALCNWAVRMVLRADRGGSFSFAPLHGEFADAVIARYPSLLGTDSLVLVEDAWPAASRGGTGEGTPESGDSGEARVHVRSDAVLRSLDLLGGGWRLLRVFALIPRPIRDWAYDLLARWRYRLFGRFETCPVPPPEVRDRFLD